MAPCKRSPAAIARRKLKRRSKKFKPQKGNCLKKSNQPAKKRKLARNFSWWKDHKKRVEEVRNRKSRVSEDSSQWEISLKLEKKQAERKKAKYKKPTAKLINPFWNHFR